jgi:hypothetical protein
MRSLLVLALALTATACTDNEGATRALESMGMSDIQLTGYEWTTCSDSDTFHTGFRATNQAGKKVSGVVCCGWFKDCTVRF